MKKFIKWSMIIFIILLLATLTGLGFYISIVYINAKSLNINQDVLKTPSLSIEIYDKDNNLIEEDNEINKKYVNFNEITKHTKQAFISIEDKNFYSHNGINYKRIAKAMLKNIKSRSFKEGASTITQQLIKNTQLTSEKTFKRKIKEIALSKKLEKIYSKDKILELYLNVIYFGNNCYGIESASNYYFSKTSKDLNIDESAMLAGIIKSPAKYSPIRNKNNCLKRRNLVLKQMYNDKNISFFEYNNAINKNINLNLNTTKKNKLNSYSQATIDEAEMILKLPARQIALNGYKIYSYQNSEKQGSLYEAIKKQNLTCDSAGIVINNKKHSIEAYIGDSIYKILDAKRQPGSCIKPLLVYAPAINEDIIYPCTELLDQKTNIGNYNPKNVGNTYKGYVSARESLSKSINIPAIKVLSYIGIEKGKSYAENMGLNFDSKDNSYTLALGGMTYGTNIQELAGAYTTFANKGVFAPPSFISFITDKNNNLIYMHRPKEKQVLKEDTAFLTTDLLKTCVKNGTAKKLNELNIDLASKTGTVGKPNSKQNLDAWNISYTDNQTCGIWLGNLNNNPINYAGGNQPTEIVKNYFQKIDDKSTFERPNTIVEKNIDLIELNENHRIILANNSMPERYTKKELFSIFNLPQETSEKFITIEKPIIKSFVENHKVFIEFSAKEYLSYKIYSNNQILKTISNLNGKQILSFPLNNKQEDFIIEYFYTVCPDIKERQSLSFINSNNNKNNNEKWFI